MLFHTQEPYPLKHCDVTSYRPDHIRLDKALEDTLHFASNETVFCFQSFNYTHRCMIKQNIGSVLESSSVEYNLLFIILEYKNIIQNVLFQVHVD